MLFCTVEEIAILEHIENDRQQKYMFSMALPENVVFVSPLLRHIVGVSDDPLNNI